MAYHHTEKIKHSHVTQKHSTDSHLGSTHTTPEEFENVALFVRLGLHSTLSRLQNGSFRKRPPRNSHVFSLCNITHEKITRF